MKNRYETLDRNYNHIYTLGKYEKLYDFILKNDKRETIIL